MKNQKNILKKSLKIYSQVLVLIIQIMQKLFRHTLEKFNLKKLKNKTALILFKKFWPKSYIKLIKVIFGLVISIYKKEYVKDKIF